ncbi:MAG: alpha/beta fold hydrolase [Steroidobacteraceae bacterium]
MTSRRDLIRIAVSGATLYPLCSWARGRPIAEARYVPIGGIEQWVQIRGDDRDNPALLWLNGGPGYSTIPDTPGYRQWEQYFTVVMWDQRGEGKTLERSGTSVAPTMTIERMAEDGIELVEYLCRHLRKTKIILLGHSWGSILGIHMIKLRPDLFSAYVGTGQIVDLERDAEAAYPLLLERAKALHNTVAVKQLERVGPPPYPDSPKKWVWIRWANALDPQPPGVWATLRDGKRAPADIEEGAEFSQGLMWSSIMHDDLPKLGLDFKVPIFFIQGAEDELAVTALARTYFDQIHAPLKKFIVLPRVGHLAIFTARKAFLAQLVKWVRPVVMARAERASARLSENRAIG